MDDVTSLIAGSRRPGGSGRELTVVNPSDGSPVVTVLVCDETDVHDAVAAAREAAPGWARTAPAARGAALHAAANAVEAAAGELAAVMSAEMGKPVADARDSVLAGVGTLRQY